MGITLMYIIQLHSKCVYGLWSPVLQQCFGTNSAILYAYYIHHLYIDILYLHHW